MLKYQVSRCNEIGFKLLLLISLMLVTWQALSPLPIEQVQNFHDKLGHLLVFFLLAAITDHAYATSSFTLKKAGYLMVYGIGIECIQHFIPNRSFSFLDMLADAGGLLLFWFLATYLLKRELTPLRHPDSN